jgi:hypothetical protein
MWKSNKTWETEAPVVWRTKMLTHPIDTIVPSVRNTVFAWLVKRARHRPCHPVSRVELAIGNAELLQAGFHFRCLVRSLRHRSTCWHMSAVGWWQSTFVEAPKAKVVRSFEATQPLGLHHQPACGTRAHATRWKKVAALEANGEGERMPRPMANSFWPICRLNYLLPLWFLGTGHTGKQARANRKEAKANREQNTNPGRENTRDRETPSRE